MNWNRHAWRVLTLVAFGALATGCERHVPTSLDEQGTPAGADRYDDPSIRLTADQLTKLRAIRRGERPEGVYVGSLAAKLQSTAPFASIEEGSEGESAPGCVPSYTVTCLQWWADADLPSSQNSSSYFGGGQMLYANGATVEIDVGGYIQRDEYWMGFDYIVMAMHKSQRNLALVSNVWGSTCASGKYNKMAATQVSFAVLYTLDIDTWGPRTYPTSLECNTSAPRYSGEDMCGGNEQLRASTDLQGTSALSEPYPCQEESGGGGGEGQSWVCDWFQYEISYDGGLTWYPYGDPWEECWYEYASLQLSDSTGRSTDRFDLTLLGQAALPDGARAFIYRDLRSNGRLTLAVDTARTSGTDLEASFYGLKPIESPRVLRRLDYLSPTAAKSAEATCC